MEDGIEVNETSRHNNSSNITGHTCLSVIGVTMDRRNRIGWAEIKLMYFIPCVREKKKKKSQTSSSF